jgi:hypothetical protein
MRIKALLDAGFRRHDEIPVLAAIFNRLLEQVPPRAYARDARGYRSSLHAFARALQQRASQGCQSPAKVRNFSFNFTGGTP